MNSARINNPDHKKLVEDIKHFCRVRGFQVVNAGYEKSLDGLSRQIGRINDPTALLWRGSSDLLAVHDHKKTCFEIEAKTATVREGIIYLEALPLAHHISLAYTFEVECLYVVRSVNPELDKAFWCIRPPPIVCVYVPRKEGQSDITREYYKRVLKKQYNCPVFECGSTNGSNDPYAVMTWNAPEWVGWHDEIDRKINVQIFNRPRKDKVIPRDGQLVEYRLLGLPG